MTRPRPLSLTKRLPLRALLSSRAITIGSPTAGPARTVARRDARASTWTSRSAIRCSIASGTARDAGPPSATTHAPKTNARCGRCSKGARSTCLVIRSSATGTTLPLRPRQLLSRTRLLRRVELPSRALPTTVETIPTTAPERLWLAGLPSRALPTTAPERLWPAGLPSRALPTTAPGRLWPA